MQTYLVGGAVRDSLMGLPVRDRDWVVVGASPQELLDQGYLAVGLDFPVFLHPETKEEYALARTERKTAPGYRGFAVHAAPEVTLEEDLARRDLTINSIAVCADHIRTGGTFDLKDLRDPYGGQQDITNRVLRHTTPAFAEDPVRILRLARFAARFTDFTVAPETQGLMQSMVQQGEVDHLVAERVWQELARGLMERQPSRMFEVLRACGALQRLLPELDRLWGVPQSVEHHPEVDTGIHVMMVLDMAAQLGASLPVRFAALTHDLGKGTTPADVLPRHIAHEERSVRLLKGVCQRLRVPTECAELAQVVAREHGNIHRSATLDAAATLRLLERCDAFRKPERFADVLLACECDARGRLGLQDTPYPQRLRLAAALASAQSVATDLIAAHAQAAGAKGPKIGEMIAKARARAIAEGF
ncbi:multifunctional CCA addition/repair protein [Rhodoferax saidenbachensis]|uniref:Multifunctional CCA protein n=1 Tax=Rhodoferax saidenbachensis TaxID=1484693 RepID=A0A1P8K6V7_9BURK|nr:multifunctional CCA addition/repair protein [Rhodoferax saidenbachensis]APW41738.1 multifunctional CCA tRNA nucleotidyl transferase/2'3'-cyclic phosphodiesterase/2'nucleotidase/phosphatase [Rhodoferax saidenbachensis]